MDDKKRRHAQQTDQVVAKRQTRSMADSAALGYALPRATTYRESVVLARRNRKWNPMVDESHSQEHGSASNEQESPSEQDESASEAQETADDSSDESDHNPKEFCAKSSGKLVDHEPIWSEQGSANGLIDRNDSRVEPRSRGSWEWGEAVPRPFKSSRELWFESNAGRITEKSHQLEKRISSQNRRRKFATILVHWEAFCDDHYEGEYLIEGQKLALFLKELTLIASTEAQVCPTSSSRGQRGLRVGRHYQNEIGWTRHDPAVNPQEARREADVIIARFKAAQESAQDKECFMYAPPTAAYLKFCLYVLRSEWKHQHFPSRKTSLKSSAWILKAVLQTYRRSLVHSPAPSTSISAENTATTSDSEVPISSDTTPSTNPTNGVATELTRWRKHTLSSNTKNPLTMGSAEGFQTFDRVMTSIGRPTTLNAGFLNIRDRASFSLRHQMILSEDYLRHIDLMNCFADMYTITSSGDPVNVIGLSFCLQRGRGFLGADTEISVAIRHKDYRRCTVGSLALYLFSRFHMQGEEHPNFSDPDIWQRVKLLRGSNSFQEVSRDQQNTLDSKTAKQLDVDLSTLQQVGKASGLAELRSNGLNIALPARLASDGMAIPGAEAMAGFHNTRYDLERDRLLPPISLQRRIFPWIEDQYGWMAPADWKAHCDRVMQSPTALPGLEGSAGIEMRRRLEAAEESEEAYHDVSKLQLMHLLLWLRRVVLQDAVLFKRDSFAQWIVKDKMFQSAEFDSFQRSLLAAMEADGGANQIDDGDQVETHQGLLAPMGTNREPSSSEVGDQEDLAIQDTPSLDVISDFSHPQLLSRSLDVNDGTPKLMDRTTPIDRHRIPSEQFQRQIRHLQQRADQQEQGHQQQEQHLVEQAALVKSVLNQQDSMDAKVNGLQTQIQTIQTMLISREDSQIKTLDAMLRGRTSDLKVETNHTSILPILLAANERSVSTALATGKVVSKSEQPFASGSLTSAPEACGSNSSQVPVPGVAKKTLNVKWALFEGGK